MDNRITISLPPLDGHVIRKGKHTGVLQPASIMGNTRVLKITQSGTVHHDTKKCIHFY